MKANNAINAIKVKQWLNEWNDVPFGPNRKKPEPHFYLFSISANALKKLSKVYPRKADSNRNAEVGVQRKHDPERSRKIRQYILGGFPWSDLSETKRESKEFSNLKMPGWLPTAIIANILSPGSHRGGVQIDDTNVITISNNEGNIHISLPKGFESNDWDPIVPPIEIIDGQHRLWAFEKEEELSGDFELPVVAFYDLDISWQAYLFYTINIKPKKINASLAFDLYPVLRTQEWLERSPEGAFVYKETRAQELVEALWGQNESPWKDRINMLGEQYDRTSDKVMPTITQAAYIRNLVASFIKTSTTKGLGGLFGAPLKNGNLLFWNRTQQAAFLIFAWTVMKNAVVDSDLPWAINLRNVYSEKGNENLQEEVKGQDPAFVGKLSLISTDQGVRGFLHVINDMIYMFSANFDLNSIEIPDEIKEDRIDAEDLSKALNTLNESAQLKDYLIDICSELVKFDWRTASTPGLTNAERLRQMVYKGSSGYRELRTGLLNQLSNSNSRNVSIYAKMVINELGYAK